MTQRTFGWVQNPSSFENLKRTVGLFVPNSYYHQQLTTILNDPNFNFRDNETRLHLQQIIYQPVIKPTYIDLVGRAYEPRSSAPCDALVQAIIPSQKVLKPYIDNWSAAGFVRWAESLGFIDYQEDSDSFMVTDLGYNFVCSGKDFSENNPLEKGLLSYPPVHRILTLLRNSKNEPLSKFQIGSQLGFMGESGFTSISHDLVFEQLTREVDKEQIRKIRSNVEGSSDKYARMICGWLINMGWVDQADRLVFNNKLNKDITFGHCFKITLKGLQKLNLLEGKSCHAMIPKRISWYMLATNAENKDYLRNRRFAILYFLKNKRNFVPVQDIVTHVNTVVGGGNETTSVIKKDLLGLQGMGLQITLDNQNHIKLLSSFSDFKPPKDVDYRIKPKNENLEAYKRLLLEKLPYLKPELVELVEISRDKNQSRIFEMKVSEILKEHFGFNSLHLGGVSKPDCICWRADIEDNWGIIIDAKAYKNGFGFPISERDKMIRYVDENEKRDKAVNHNEWWLSFPADLKNYYFLFVSSEFSKNASDSLNNIYIRTGVKGGALNVEQLLLGANYIAHSRNYIELEKFLDNTDIRFFDPINFPSEQI